MHQVVSSGAPPLPPKTRRSSPPVPSAASSTTTVLTAADPEQHDEVFRCRFSDTGTSQAGNHVVKIRINPEEAKSHQSISISVNAEAMNERNNPYFFCSSFSSSGQVSPSDTLDSGTCSDLDSTPPPLPKKKSGVTVTVIGAHLKRPASTTSSGADVDSDGNESSISCDSLNNGELIEMKITNGITPKVTNGFLPKGLLQDIRDHNKQPPDVILQSAQLVKAIVHESTYEDRKKEKDVKPIDLTYDTDRFYNFHLNENAIVENSGYQPAKVLEEDEYFAGYKDLLGSEGSSTIRSAKGTVRGVKNRVRAGIATFLQINSTTKVRVLHLNQNAQATVDYLL